MLERLCERSSFDDIRDSSQATNYREWKDEATVCVAG